MIEETRGDGGDAGMAEMAGADGVWRGEMLGLAGLAGM